MNINPSESWRWQDDPKAPQIFSICRKLLAAEMEVVEACREMELVLGEMWQGYWDWGHGDFSLIREVARATREFPVGAVRQYWSAKALELKDRERGCIEAQYRERIVSEAKRVLVHERAAQPPKD